MITHRPCAERGVTLIEVVVMTVVTMALVAALAPTVSATIRRAEQAAALSTMNTIALQINLMLNEIGYDRFSSDGEKTGLRVNLLVSDGDTPRDCSVIITACTSWQAAVDNTLGLTDFLERHLATDNPRGNPANGYLTSADGKWYGPYLNPPIDPDPWGNRYAVNAGFISGISNNDVVVFSAGPDEEIDTLYGADPLTAGDDDLIVLVEP